MKFHTPKCLLLGGLAAALLLVGCQSTTSVSETTSAPAEDSFARLHGGLTDLPLLTGAVTRSITPENMTGEKGRGAMAVPDPDQKDPPISARAADHLGQGWKVRPFLRVNAGQQVTLMDVDGPGVIQHLWMVEGLSRDHVLRFYWDDEETPSIEVPAPDFFGVGHERFGAIDSAAVTVNPKNALNSWWPMPFRRHARITFTNEGEKDLMLLAFQITYELRPVPANAGYLHAQWRRARTGEKNPYVILDGVKGQGRYVGTVLSWTQRTNQKWWGEGEVKFFIDGDDPFPTISGTGTEDYFLGSWGFRQTYASAYAGHTLAEERDNPLPNHWNMYRWHIMDPVNFAQDLKVTVQALGWSPTSAYLKLDDDISSVAIWYQTEPHAPFPTLPPAAERKPLPSPDDPASATP